MIIRLDVSGPLADQQHRRLAIEPLDLVLLGIAVAAVDPERVLHDLVAVLRGKHFAIPASTSLRSPPSLTRAALTIIACAASTLVAISASRKRTA